ncbi:MAG: NAD+ synthase [Thermoplasmata archaeon]|nr:NAD+ synthase [Thermoplasmata archaeon]MCI4359040.1 NAD+ synthase [Thermoplasmata archaeon]
MTSDLVPRLPDHAEETIARFLRAHVSSSAGVVVGLSGGVDSALCARLARDALGAGSVLAVALPDAGPSQASVSEASEYARTLGVACRVVPVGPIVAALRAQLPTLQDPTDVGNATARIRMAVLYGIARETGRRVLGTGNKSEILLGYFTKFGDGGVDLLPIGDLYKTEVWELSGRLALPEAIRERVPTAGFWPGQTDEAELGLPYREVDRILRGLEELRSEEEIARLTGQSRSVVAGVLARVASNRHKRRLPPIPKLALRTVGIDWRD